MAREEADREDLLREATALVERVELALPGEPAPVVAGFRRDGALSLYFGPDPVYQFNAAGQLRRAFVAGLLYKCEGGRLIALRRQRQPAGVFLVRRALAASETESFLASLAARLEALRARLAGGAFVLIGEVPFGANVVDRCSTWLAAQPRCARLADSPRARGSRSREDSADGNPR